MLTQSFLGEDPAPQPVVGNRVSLVVGDKIVGDFIVPAGTPVRVMVKGIPFWAQLLIGGFVAVGVWSAASFVGDAIQQRRRKTT